MEGGNVYLTTGDTPGSGGAPNNVVAVPTDGIGPAKTLIQRSEYDPGRFTADATHLYFIGDALGSGRSLERLSLEDGSTDSLFDVGQFDVSSANDPLYANGSLYWQDQNGVERLSLADKTMTHLGPPQGVGASLDVSAVGTDAVYMVSSSGAHSSGILRATFDDQVSVVLPPGNFIVALAVDDDAIYYATSDGDQYDLLSMPIAGGTPQQLAVADTITAAAVDGDDLYFAKVLKNTMQTTLAKIPKHGGSVSAITSDDTLVSKIAFDATNVYWIDFAGRLQMLGKTAVELGK